MYHVATRVVENTHLEQEATTPDTVRSDAVAEGQPQRHKQHPSLEAHSCQEGTGYEHKRDGSEGELEVDHGALRESLAEVCTRQV